MSFFRKFILTLSLGACFSAAAQGTSEKPNIILFLADDFGWSDCQYYNSNSLIDMPNIETLASQGISYSDAHAPSSLCQPSRTAILIGNYPYRGGGAWNWNAPSNLPEGQNSLAQMLKNNGYRTSIFGKEHIGGGIMRIDGGVYRGSSWAKNAYKDMDFTQPRPEGNLSRGFDYGFVLAGGIQDPPYAYFENDILQLQLPTGITPPANFIDQPVFLEEDTDRNIVVWAKDTLLTENGSAQR